MFVLSIGIPYECECVKCTPATTPTTINGNNKTDRMACGVKGGRGGGGPEAKQTRRKHGIASRITKSKQRQRKGKNIWRSDIAEQCVEFLCFVIIERAIQLSVRSQWNLCKKKSARQNKRPTEWIAILGLLLWSGSLRYFRLRLQWTNKKLSKNSLEFCVVEKFGA